MASGVQPGDRVAIWAPNSARVDRRLVRRLPAGAVLVPLNTRYRGDEAGHVLRTVRRRGCCSPSPTSSAPTTSASSTGSTASTALEERIVLTGGAPRRHDRLGRLPRPRRAAVAAEVDRRPSRRDRARRHSATSSSRRARRARPRARCSPTAPACAPTARGASWSACAPATGTSSSTRSSTPPA